MLEANALDTMNDRAELQAFVNGAFLPLSQATLHISDLAIQRGYGIFDYFKASGQVPLFLDDYLDRFYTSASLMYLEVPYTKDELRAIISQLLQQNSIAESGVKMILTGGYSENSFDIAAANLIIQQQPLQMPSAAKVQQGISIITHEYLRDFPVIKTINYTMGIRLLHHMREQNAEETLYVSDGVVTEFPRCNFFIVTKENTLVTPAHNILRGITRKNILALAAKKYKIEERDISLAEVYAAQETFLTSTTKRILPIVQVNGKQIGTGTPGPVTLGLLQDLIALEHATVAEAAR